MITFLILATAVIVAIRIAKRKHLICKVFGHKQNSGWWGDALYGKISGGYVDGVSRQHFQVNLDCDRCGERYIAARFHAHQLDKKLAVDVARDPRS